MWNRHPLGVVADQQFDDYPVDLHRGDRVVLFSDGLIDARKGADSFGEEGVRKVLDGLPNATPKEVVERLLAASRAHAEGHAPDDIAVLAITYVGMPEATETA